MGLKRIAHELGRPLGTVAHEAARLKLFRPRGTNWTGEEMARIAQLWPDYSASQIGEKLGRSRNAVIGVVHRLREKMKLKHKTSAHVRPHGIAMANQPCQQALPKPKPQPKPRPRAMLPMQCHCQLVELDAINCKWPYGDPHQAGFYFCGAVIEQDGRPYCAAHARIASVPSRPPSSRRPAPNYGLASVV
jgi:GcrA cell cycle regulator